METVGSFLTPILFSTARITCLQLSATFTLVLLLTAYLYYKNVYTFWRKRGLSGPTPLPLVGNLIQLLLSNRMKVERKLVAKYGKVYGIFQGARPRLVIADPEIVRQISIKDFDVFPNHGMNVLLNRYEKEFLFFMRDDHWRRIRAMMSPTFTSGKIKRMYKLLDACCEDLNECLREQLQKRAAPIKGGGVVVNIKEIFGLYTMDGIASCCYGLKLERNGSASIKTAASRDDFVEAGMKIFRFNIGRIVLSLTLPRAITRAFGFHTTPESELKDIADRVEKLIEIRRKSSRKFDDYLQLLIDAKLDDEMELNELDSKENHHAGLTHNSLLADQKRMVQQVVGGGDNQNNLQQQPSKAATTGTAAGTKRVEMSQFEVLASAMFLLVVGLETTATLLTNCAYALAFHQEIQNKLVAEIKSIATLEDDPEASDGSQRKKYSFGYDELTSLHYLDSVICETLRALTPIIQIDRQAEADYHIDKYNVAVPKGAKVIFAFHAIMNDPDYWPNPERFDPQRFMPENRDSIVPGSYCPFGLGPRHCIGMRFSLTEAKLALAKVLMEFRFEPAPNTSYPPEPAMTFGINRLKRPFVTVKRR